tara:strand:+ start:2316 stop:2510 length:195 start_codon:yes stop_codon:yes gene_type:complete
VNKMGKMSQLSAMLDYGMSAEYIADWVFSLKVQRGEDINENTKSECLDLAKKFKQEREIQMEEE